MRLNGSFKSGIARWSLSLFFIISTLICVSIPVSADVGPKPSVSVSIRGLPAEVVYYATLLSETSSNGPLQAFQGEIPKSDDQGELPDIWEKFVRFEDPDGFYYLQEHWSLQGNGSFSWGYYPPDTFKLLLYFPEYDSFVVSERTERYTFESTYIADLKDIDYQTPGTTSVVNIEPADPHFIIAISDALIRIVLTLAIELLLALAFGYRAKKQLIFISIVNIITQLLMNAVLVFFRHEAGFFISALSYVLMEFFIFTIEAELYAIFLKPLSEKPISRGKTVLYAFVANFLSCIIGLLSGVLYYALT